MYFIENNNHLEPLEVPHQPASRCCGHPDSDASSSVDTFLRCSFALTSTDMNYIFYVYTYQRRMIIPSEGESTCEKVLPSSPPENPEVCIKTTTLKQIFQVIKGQYFYQMILFFSQGKAGENELPELDEKSPFSNRDELRLHQLPTRLKVWFGLDNILPAASIKLIRNCFLISL